MGLLPQIRPSLEVLAPLLILTITLAPNQRVAANVNLNMNIFKLQEQQFMGRDASREVFRSDTEEVFPVAYYDINADKLTDVITVSRDRSSIDIFLAYTEKPYLRRAFNSQVIISERDPERRIVSVRPGDFTGDGMADLMITLGKDKITSDDYLDGIGSSVEVIFCLIRFGGETNLQCSQLGAGAVIKDLVQEPTVLDLNGDMVMDLLGEKWINGGNNTKVKKRMIWISESTKESFEWTTENFKVVGEFAHKQIHEMINVSSNAYADVDGDNIPELLILTEDPFTPRENGIYYLETYKLAKDLEKRVAFRLKTDDTRVKINPINQVTKVMGQPIIVDFEHNGKLSYLVPYCTDLDCKKTNGIYVIENGEAIPLPLGPMEYEGKKWGFIPPPNPPVIRSAPSPTPNPTTTPTTTTTTTTASTLPPYHPEYYPMEDFYSRTIVLRIGDYNLDGYPDLLGVLVHKGDTKMTRGVLFENVACAKTEQNPCNYSRTFSPNFKILEKYPNAISASFYDIGDNGVLDVIVVAQEQNNKSVAPQSQRFAVKAFENEMNFDSSFLKVMVLTGQPCSRCESGIPYGNVLPGATIKYTSHNTRGQEETGVMAQTYRTAHIPLDLPSEIFGIGHSPNFIETLVVAIAANEEALYRRSWYQIIPNSQVVVVPNPLERPDKWTMKLFLTPSDIVLKTFGILVALCVIFATLVGALEFKERREDRLVRQSEAHRIVMY